MRFLPQKLEQNSEIIRIFKQEIKLDKEAILRWTEGDIEISEIAKNREVALQKSAVEGGGIKEGAGEGYHQLPVAEDQEVNGEDEQRGPDRIYKEANI